MRLLGRVQRSVTILVTAEGRRLALRLEQVKNHRVAAVAVESGQEQSLSSFCSS